MSKQSEQKEKQGFQKNSPNCANCVNFSSQRIENKSGYGANYFKETSLRCNVGGFKVGKSNWCKLHCFKTN